MFYADLPPNQRDFFRPEDFWPDTLQNNYALPYAIPAIVSVELHYDVLQIFRYRGVGVEEIRIYLISPFSGEMPRSIGLDERRVGLA